MTIFDPSRFRRPLRLLVFGLATILVAGIWYCRQPPPLTTEEQQLVGVWTLPMGPPRVPPTTVQQIFKLTSDRTLVTYGRRVSNGSLTTPSSGNWKLEGDSLVFERSNPNYWRQLAVSLDGGRRPQRTRNDRMPYLGADPDTICFAADGGDEITFERFDETREKTNNRLTPSRRVT